MTEKPDDPLYDELEPLAEQDIKRLFEKYHSYRNSWKKRSGPGAAFMLLRKVDRLENVIEGYRYDIFKAIEEDSREEGIMDDLNDLIGYAMLIRAEMTVRNKEENNE